MDISTFCTKTRSVTRALTADCCVGHILPLRDGGLLSQGVRSVVGASTGNSAAIVIGPTVAAGAIIFALLCVIFVAYRGRLVRWAWPAPAANPEKRSNTGGAGHGADTLDGVASSLKPTLLQRIRLRRPSTKGGPRSPSEPVPPHGRQGNSPGGSSQESEVETRRFFVYAAEAKRLSFSALKMMSRPATKLLRMSQRVDFQERPNHRTTEWYDGLVEDPARGSNSSLSTLGTILYGDTQRPPDPARFMPGSRESQGLTGGRRSSQMEEELWFDAIQGEAVISIDLPRTEESQREEEQQQGTISSNKRHQDGEQHQDHGGQ